MVARRMQEETSQYSGLYSSFVCFILIYNVYGVQHPDFPRFLNSTHWTHLKLTKRAETLRLIEKSGYKSRKIIEFSDKQEVINVTHMIVHSKMVNALWKFHQGNKTFSSQKETIFFIFS
jgi:hypothetical protein